MSRDRQARREDRRAEARALDAALSPGQWLLRHGIWPAAVAGFLGGIGISEQDPGVLLPMLAIGLFWGGAVFRGYLNRRQKAALGLLGAQPRQGSEEEETAPPVAAPLRPAQGSTTTVTDTAPTTELERLVAEVGLGLRRHGRERVSLTLERGLAELHRVESLAAGLGAAESAETLRAELGAMRARAEAAEDPTAKALWNQNAEAVERRIGKRRSLNVAHDRVAARVEGFRQAVKSLALDVARLDLVGDAGKGLEQVDAHAIGVEREVEALLGAHDEIAALEAADGLRVRSAAADLDSSRSTASVAGQRVSGAS